MNFIFIGVTIPKLTPPPIQADLVMAAFVLAKTTRSRLSFTAGPFKATMTPTGEHEQMDGLVVNKFEVLLSKPEMEIKLTFYFGAKELPSREELVRILAEEGLPSDGWEKGDEWWKN